MGNPFSKAKDKRAKKLSSGQPFDRETEPSADSRLMLGHQRQGSASSRQKKKKNIGIRASKLAERLAQLEGFRHFVKLNVCSVVSTLSFAPLSATRYTMLAQGSMSSSTISACVPGSGPISFASPSFSTHSDAHQQWSVAVADAQTSSSRVALAARLSHLEFDAICRNFDSAATTGLPGTWTLSTLQEIICLSEPACLRLYSWIRLSTAAFPSAAATQELNDLIANMPCIAFEELFQWLIDCLYPASPLSSLLSETVKSVNTVSSQLTSVSFSAGSSGRRRLPWSSHSPSISHGAGQKRPLALAAGRTAGPPGDVKIPYELWFYLFASHFDELTKPKAPAGPRLRSQTNVLSQSEKPHCSGSEHEGYFYEIRNHYYLTKANFKSLLRWILDLQFVQISALPSAEPLADEAREELRICHRLVEGIIENSLENLYLSPIVTKLPLCASGASYPETEPALRSSGLALSLFSDFSLLQPEVECELADPSCAVAVLSFHTWRDWVQRNLPRLFDVFPSFLRARFLELPCLPPIVPEQAVPSPSASPSSSFRTHAKHASIVSLAAILPDSKAKMEGLASAGSSFDRLRRVSESSAGTLATPAAREARAASLPLAEPSYSSLILDTALLWLLYHCLPEYSLPWHSQSSLSSGNRSNDSAYSMLVPWELLYSTMRDGYSMTQFRHCCFDYPGSTLLLIQGECVDGSNSSQSVVLGAVVSTPWKISGTSWGNEDCVIVLLYPVLEVLQAKGRVEAMRERRQTTLAPGTAPLGSAPARGYSSTLSPSFYAPPGSKAAARLSSSSPTAHPMYCHAEHGIGFGGTFTTAGAALTAKPDAHAFRLYIDAYFSTCTLSLHGQDDTFCASYLPFSTASLADARSTSQKAKAALPILLPEPVKLSIAHLEVFGLAGPDALAKWSQSKALDKRLAEQRQSINVKLKRRELESEKMLLNLVGIVSEFS